MDGKYSPEELAELAKSPGWHLDAGDQDKPATGSLEDVAKAAHAQLSSGKRPGIVKQIETSIELDMLQLEQLWRYLGLPV
jgi:hypothetical protein